MKRYHYITPCDYETAKNNGINKRTVHARVRDLGWDIDKAITEPQLHRLTYTEDHRQIMKENNVTHTMVRTRMKRWGITQDEAVRIPRKGKREVKELAVEGNRQSNNFFTPEQRRLMKENGIPYGTAYMRAKRYRYSKDEAVTMPIQDNLEALARGREKSPWKMYNAADFARGRAK